MSEEVINPLRRRMIEDMKARNLDEGTQPGYLRAVRSCSRYCGRGPGQLTFEDVRCFQLPLIESGLAPGSVNSIMVGLRFFFRVTPRRPEALERKQQGAGRPATRATIRNVGPSAQSDNQPERDVPTAQT